MTVLETHHTSCALHMSEYPKIIPKLGCLVHNSERELDQGPSSSDPFFAWSHPKPQRSLPIGLKQERPCGPRVKLGLRTSDAWAQACYVDADSSLGSSMVKWKLTGANNPEVVWRVCIFNHPLSQGSPTFLG